MNCRHCNTTLSHIFLDLGHAPLSNAYLASGELEAPELYYPLKLYVCGNCWLVQTKDCARTDELFRHDYAYFSSTSTSWLDHAARFTSTISARLGLDRHSFVIEVASNDGYLLRNFVAAGIPCLGIEPTAATAESAARLGVPVLREFFGRELGERLASEGKRADLIVGNNVFAHVPDINDFTAGLKAALKPDGTISLEFPHLMRLIEHAQFDTVYHEHFSYISLHTAMRIFEKAGLRIWDVEELATHGGSLRIYGCHCDDPRGEQPSVGSILREEELRGLLAPVVYQSFQLHACRIRDDLITFLIDQKKAGLQVAAYGAAAKGNTLLNYAGVKPDLLPFVCDAAVSKQGKFLPGSHIPILPPSALTERRPDIVLILPWNIADEIVDQHAYVREWGGKFAVAVPRMRIIAK
jgi:SAM-dependent methyltransferase